MSTQVKRFWPPIKKHKLLYANLVVYGVTVVLLAMLHNELMWAQKTLRGLLFAGGAPPSEDRLLIAQAIQGVKNGENVEHIQQLFEQAVEIEPYSEAKLMLGYCYLRRGKYDKMLACYEQYRLVNPSHIDVYKYIIEVLEKKQDRRAIAQLITEGIEHFRRRVELYKPHYDPNLPSAFNQKALMVYKESQEGLKYLEEMQKKLIDSK